MPPSAPPARYPRALLDDTSTLRQFRQAAMDPVLCIDEYGLVVLWNDRAERTFGWTREKAFGHDLRERKRQEAPLTEPLDRHHWRSGLPHPRGVPVIPG